MAGRQGERRDRLVQPPLRVDQRQPDYALALIGLVDRADRGDLGIAAAVHLVRDVVVLVAVTGVGVRQAGRHAPGLRGVGHLPGVVLQVPLARGLGALGSPGLGGPVERPERALHRSGDLGLAVLAAAVGAVLVPGLLDHAGDRRVADAALQAEDPLGGRPAEDRPRPGGPGRGAERQRRALLLPGRR